jgi:hypothetical protein
MPDVSTDLARWTDAMALLATLGAVSLVLIAFGIGAWHRSRRRPSYRYGWLSGTERR